MAPRPKGVPFREEWIPRSTNLTLTVTTHRIVLSTSSGGGSASASNDLRFLHLANVHVVSGAGGPSFQSPRATYKIVISTYTYGDVLLVFRTTSGGLAQQKRDRDASLQELERALTRKQWETQQRLQERAVTQEAVARRRVGVDHVLTKNKIRHQQAAKLAEEALSGDAEQLLQEAGALLKVIQKYTVLLERYNADGERLGGDDDDEESARKLASLLSDMGMTSALTRSQVVGRGGGGGPSKMSASSQQDYYELTARQLADFLIPRLTAQSTDGSKKKKLLSQNSDRDDTGRYGSGIMTLTDVYCLFNRARGTNLISPEDLREACALLGDLKVGLSQRIFPSGVIVIQLDALALDGTNGATIRQTLLGLCPTTAMEASHVLRLSPLLAMEQLEEAERLGWLCRDTTLETVRFYPNQFVEWTAES